MVKHRGLNEKGKVFCWSSSTKNPTRLVVDARATFADWVDWTRAVAGVADVWAMLVSVRKINKKGRAGLGDRTRELCAKIRAR